MSRGFRIWDKASECYLPVSRGGDDGVLGVTIDGTGIIYLEDGEVNIQSAEDAGVIIERSTGLKDKNGKEINDGDIVKRIKEVDLPRNSVEVEIFRIRWGVKKAGFFLYNKARSRHNQPAKRLGSNDCLEVIGNIHDNPELLKGER